MIACDLICSIGHQYRDWFDNMPDGQASKVPAIVLTRQNKRLNDGGRAN